MIYCIMPYLFGKLDVPFSDAMMHITSKGTDDSVFRSGYKGKGKETPKQIKDQTMYETESNG